MVIAQAAFPNGPWLGQVVTQLGPSWAQPGPIWNAAWVVTFWQWKCSNMLMAYWDESLKLGH